MNEALIAWYESNSHLLENWDIRAKDSEGKAFRFRSATDGMSNGLLILERALQILPKGQYVIDGWRTSATKEKHTLQFSVLANPVSSPQQQQQNLGYYGGGRNTEYMIPWQVHQSQVELAVAQERVRGDAEMRLKLLELRHEIETNVPKKSIASEIKDFLKEIAPAVPEISNLTQKAGAIMNKNTGEAANEVARVVSNLPKADNSQGFSINSLTEND